MIVGMIRSQFYFHFFLCRSEIDFLFEIDFDYGVGHTAKHKFDVLGVGGAREVRVDLFADEFVQAMKHSVNVSTRLFVVVRSLILRKADGNGDIRIFSLNKSFLFKKSIMDVSLNQ